MQTICKECGSTVSELEESCGNCGTKKDISNVDTMVSESAVTMESNATFHSDVTMDSNVTLESNAPQNTEPEKGGTKPLENSRLSIHDEDLVGKSLGGAVVKKVIGKGGMGSVFLAHHLTLDIPVAVKVLKPAYAQRSPDAVERFIKEARAVAKLRHPNIVSVYNAGFEEGVNFMSMEFIEGRDLAELLESPFNMSLKDALKLTCQVCDALDYAHKNNIVHRDIKPANIFVDEEGTAKVGDLGLAKDLEDDQSMTQSMQAMGTPYYISPEQATNAKEVDHRTDIYSLGCTLYRLFCGKVPYKGNSSFETVHKHISEPIPDPKKENPELPDTVAEVIQKMMAKKPEERYQSLKEVSKILSDLLDSISDSKIGFAPKNIEKPDSKTDPQPVQKHKLLYGIIAALIIVLSLVLYKTFTSKDASSGELTSLYFKAKASLDGGDYIHAKKLFKEYFNYRLDHIDAHIHYSVILKQAEGIEAAREEYRLWSQNSKNPSVFLAYILMLDKEARKKGKVEFENAFKSYGPYYYYLSEEWKKDPVGQTYAEKREELRLLQKMKELDSQGKFLKYFANRGNVNSFRADAKVRLENLELIQDKLNVPLEIGVGFLNAPQNPSVIIGEGARDRSRVNVQLTMYDYHNIKEIFYKYEGMKDFKSTGNNLNPEKSPIINFQMPKPDGKTIIEIKYIDKKGVLNGPFKVDFDPVASDVKASKNFMHSMKDNLVMYRHYDNRLLFYFTTLLSSSKGMKEIRYSADNKKLDKTLPFDPLNPYENPYITLPLETEKMYIQVTFKDDTKSEVLEFIKNPNLRKE